MTPQELEDLTYSHLPQAFLRRALQAVFQAHKSAWDDCRSNFGPEEADNLRPYMKRAKLEGYLRDAAAMVPGVASRVVHGPKSNWWHTEVLAGPVVLTASSVPTPCAVVEPSEFRMTLAESNQGVLFNVESKRTIADKCLYLVLLHSRSQWETRAEVASFGHLPGSAYIAYPAPGLDYYLHSVNLFDLFPEVVDGCIPSVWDHEAKIRYRSRSNKQAWA